MVLFPTGLGQQYSLRDKAYPTITISQIAKLVDEPQATQKGSARWFIPSSYHGPWARKFEIQREIGTYHFLTADIDTGSPSWEWVVGSVEAIFGDVHMMIYSSASATKDNQKWRLLIPIGDPLSGYEWQAAQTLFFNALEKEHIIADRVFTRNAQLHFLTNVPPNKRDLQGKPLFYFGRLIRGARYALS